MYIIYIKINFTGIVSVLSADFSKHTGAWFLFHEMFIKNLLEAKNIIKLCLTAHEQ